MSINTNELRYSVDTELRVADDNGGKIVGFAIVYDRASLPMVANGRRFTEVVKRGALAQTLASGAEIKADIGHAKEAVVGKRSKGTLTVTDTERGLYIELDPPNTTMGNDLREQVRRGDVGGMSFQFRTPQGGDSWERNGNEWLRTLTNIQLERVTFTDEPAYPDTSVALRSLEEAEKVAEETKEPAVEGTKVEEVEKTIDRTEAMKWFLIKHRANQGK